MKQFEFKDQIDCRLKIYSLFDDLRKCSGVSVKEIFSQEASLKKISFSD